MYTEAIKKMAGRIPAILSFTVNRYTYVADIVTISCRFQIRIYQ
jgi:hypothetical protein